MEIQWIWPVLAIIGSILASVILERVLGDALDRFMLDLLPNSARGRIIIFAILIFGLAMLIDRLTGSPVVPPIQDISQAVSDSSDPIKIDIIVKDYVNGEPIDRANVVIELIPGQEYQTYTNAEGVAHLSITATLHGQPRPFIVSAEGYQSEEGNLFLNEEESGHPILLKPLSPTTPNATLISTTTVTATQVLALCPANMQLIKQEDSAFCLDRYEVTNGEYQQCVARGICSAIITESGSWPFGESSYPINPLYTAYPVINTSVAQAANFCGAYMKLQDKLYEHPKRLPTFEEWLAAYKHTDEVKGQLDQPFPASAESLGKSRDDIYGLDSNVKEWVVVEQAQNGRILQAVAMGKSYGDDQFPMERQDIHNYEFVVDNETELIYRAEWGFRCAADPIRSG